MGPPRFLFIPSVVPGNGTGHIRRALYWVSDLPEGTAVVYIKKRQWRGEFATMAAAAGVDEGCFVCEEDALTPDCWDFAVLDRRSTAESEFNRWLRTGIPLIGLDEGGPMRRRFSYLIDTFPLPKNYGPPNIIEPGFLSLPNTRRTPSTGTGFQSALVSFGGEDPAGLTEKCTRWLIHKGGFRPEDITVVKGPLFKKQNLPAGVEVLEAPENLAEQLHRFDIVFSSFGLTAYEAAFAGCGVILLNPSRYHRRLSRLAGFPHVGVRGIHSGRLLHLLRSPDKVMGAAEGAAPREKQSLAELLGRMKPPELQGCPVCGGLKGKAVLRSPERSFFRCPSCKIVYQLDFFTHRRRYTEEYFFEEYKNQYGRSYLEDFEAIKAMGMRRISELKRLGPSLLPTPSATPLPAPFACTPQSSAGAAGAGAGAGTGAAGGPETVGGDIAPEAEEGPAPRLLDVGCAYGPFLSAAYEAGYQPEGLDPVDSAVAYVQNELGFPAWNTPFENFEGIGGRGDVKSTYDIVSMWFVLEHFTRVDRILRKANHLLTVGGLLAFSTPNSAGISGRKSLKKFLKQSPRDHHTVWTPSAARNIVPRYGFKIRKIVVTGHHPERFPGVKGVGTSKFAGEVLTRFSRIAHLGDTFEVYAEKVGDIPRGQKSGAGEGAGE